MSIVSFMYLVFLVGMTCLYYVIPKRFRWLVILAGSLAFYVSCSRQLVFFALVTAVSVWAFGRVLQRIVDANAEAVNAETDKDRKKKLRADGIRKKKLVFLMPFVLNLGILLLFKYKFMFNTFMTPVWSLVRGNRITFGQIATPVGISFYTLQAISYLLDIYRGQQKAEKNPLKLVTFVTFFPQVIQGPISRYRQLAPQLFDGNELRFDNLKNGVILIGWGFVKKLLFADRLAMLVTPVFSDVSKYGGAVIFLAAIVYGLQLYADFSGGMNIIYGAAKLLGIDMTPNFRQPYYSTSLSNFWQRWHITLGGWMRDYVFYPLSLSRPFGRLGKFCRKKFSARWAKVIISGLSSFVVFTLVGMWHGAEMKYVIYGLYNGGIIMLATMLEPVFEQWFKKTRIDPDSFWWHQLRMARTLLITTFGRCIVRSVDVASGAMAFRKMFTAPNFGQLGKLLQISGWSKLDLCVILTVFVLLFVVDWIAENREHPLEWLKKRPIVLRWLVYLGIIAALLLLIPATPITGAFIYAKF